VHGVEVGAGARVVAPLAEGGAVLERHPEIGLCAGDLQAAVNERQFVDDPLVE